MTTITIPAGFTKGIFSDYNTVQNFIWGHLYENGLQYHAPFSDVATKRIVLIYEDK